MLPVQRLTKRNSTIFTNPGFKGIILLLSIIPGILLLFFFLDTLSSCVFWCSLLARFDHRHCKFHALWSGARRARLRLFASHVGEL